MSFGSVRQFQNIDKPPLSTNSPFSLRVQTTDRDKVKPTKKTPRSADKSTFLSKGSKKLKLKSQVKSLDKKRGSKQSNKSGISIKSLVVDLSPELTPTLPNKPAVGKMLQLKLKSE